MDFETSISNNGKDSADQLASSITDARFVVVVVIIVIVVVLSSSSLRPHLHSRCCLCPHLHLCCCDHCHCQCPCVPLSPWQRRGGRGRGGGCAGRTQPPPGLGDCPPGNGLCSSFRHCHRCRQDVLACHLPHGNSKVGGAGVVGACDAAVLLLALAIVVAAPAFALVLWMPSLICSKMALLVLAFLMVLVLVLVLVLALMQLFACSLTTLCLALIEQPMPLKRQPMPPPPVWRSCPCLRAHPPCIPLAPPPLV